MSTASGTPSRSASGCMRSGNGLRVALGVIYIIGMMAFVAFLTYAIAHTLTGCS